MQVRKIKLPDVLDAVQWSIDDDRPDIEATISSYADVPLDYLGRPGTFVYRDKLGYRKVGHARLVPPGRAAIVIKPGDYIMSHGGRVCGVLTPEEFAEQYEAVPDEPVLDTTQPGVAFMACRVCGKSLICVDGVWRCTCGYYCVIEQETMTC